MEDKYVYNWSTQERVCVNSEKLDKSEKTELELLKEELDFYKSLFNTHNNSVVFNLSIKKKNGEKVWVDHVRDSREYLSTLDQDEEIKGWLEPIKPSR